MSQDLFRKEVLEARRTQWLGGISLAQSLRMWLLAAAAGTVALTVALFLVLGTYTRRSSVTGQLVPSKGLATVLAPVTGVVARVDIPEGGKVSAGQALALVTAPRATRDSGDTSQALEQRLRERHEGLSDARVAQLQVLSAQAEGLKTQLTAAQGELTQVENEIATRRQQIRIANETLERMRRLEDQRYVSILQIKQQESTALEYTSQMQGMQRQAVATRRSIAQLQQAIAELPGQRKNTEASYRRELAQLEQERVETEARGALEVVAPVGGLVATQLIKPGQAIQAGQPLLSLLPGDGRLEAELLVPSRAIGFIEQGDSVMLRYQAFPYQKFGHQQGTVERISRSALSSGELGALIGNAKQGEPYYRVTVSLAMQAMTAYGRVEQLKPGMLLDAEIMGERRRLIEWILEPLYSLKSKVSEG
jgi:membrane fusion protein